MTSSLVAPAIAGLGLLAAALFDLKHARIPDWITGPIFGLALLVRFLQAGQAGLATGLGGALVALAIALPVAFLGRLGWGDAKLLAGVGALFGWPRISMALVVISICGAVQASLAVARARGHRPESIPYGIAIAAGSALTALPAMAHG